eukprot:gene30692-37086_t
MTTTTTLVLVAIFVFIPQVRTFLINGALPISVSKSFVVLNEAYDQSQSLRTITFVSSNKNKIREVQMILGTDFPYLIEHHDLDLNELQATPVEISRNKCKAAARILQRPVMVEDTSLCFNALKGMPGPYVKWFYERIGDDGLYRLLSDFEDKSGYAQCVLSYTSGAGQEVHSFVGTVEGSVCAPRGERVGTFGWDRIFVPQGAQRSFAEMSIEEKNALSHRFKALREFKAYLSRRLP